MTQPDDTEVFAYLDALRESGVVNMFGAGQYLEEQFGFARRDALNALGRWMKQFGRNPS